jgi:hypothetical protein
MAPGTLGRSNILRQKSVPNREKPRARRIGGKRSLTRSERGEWTLPRLCFKWPDALVGRLVKVKIERLQGGLMPA